MAPTRPRCVFGGGGDGRTAGPTGTTSSPPHVSMFVPVSGDIQRGYSPPYDWTNLMCGIAGAAWRGSLQLRISMEHAIQSLAKRGPDGHGRQIWHGHDSGWDIGHARLAINDLSPAGNQPISNEDGTLFLTFNGEIYNSPALRRICEDSGHVFRSSMDGEVILHLWEMGGLEAMAQLNGIFSFAIANTLTGEVTLVRDPLGVKPLYYALGAQGSLWFASELTALAALGAPMGSEDLVAFAQFLAFLWIPDTRTPYSNARSLGPGRALRWTKSGSSVIRYGVPLVPPEDPPRISENYALDAVRELFQRSVRRQLLSDVPIGLMSSGGVDSGLLWWAAQHKISKSFTIRWEGPSSEGLSDDAAAVATLEAQFNTPVHYVSGETMDLDIHPPSGDLLCDPGYALTRVIAARARDQGFKVLLCGHGADELLGGYRRHVAARLIERLRLGYVGGVASGIMARLKPRGLNAEYLSRIARASQERDSFRAYMQLLTFSSATDRARVLGCSAREVSDDVVWQSHRTAFDMLSPKLSFLRKVMTLDLQLYLPGQGLAYVDRAGMEFGVEIRVPWLDLEFVRWTLTLPDRLLIRRRQGKWLTRQLATEVMGSQLSNRPKRGFGAPSSHIRPSMVTLGEHGHRQSRYFALAEAMVRTRGEALSTRSTLC